MGSSTCTRVAFATVMILSACGCSTKAQDTSDGATTCPNNVPLGCSCPTSYDGGVCVCSCFSTPDFAMPECPSSAQYSPTWPACEFAGSCMNCGGTAGVICNCTDAGLSGIDGGGARWQCDPTGEACTGGTFHG